MDAVKFHWFEDEVKVGSILHDDNGAMGPAGKKYMVIARDPSGCTLSDGRKVSWEQASHATMVEFSAQLDAVDMARETHCPYCTSKVALHARVISNHRTYGGTCDGSGRTVAEFDHAGRAVLEARLSMMESPQHDKIRPGSSKVQNLLNGRVYTVASWRYPEGYALLVGPSGEQESVSGSTLASNYRVDSY